MSRDSLWQQMEAGGSNYSKDMRGGNSAELKNKLMSTSLRPWLRVITRKTLPLLRQMTEPSSAPDSAELLVADQGPSTVALDAPEALRQALKRQGGDDENNPLNTGDKP